MIARNWIRAAGALALCAWLSNAEIASADVMEPTLGAPAAAPFIAAEGADHAAQATAAVSTLQWSPLGVLSAALAAMYCLAALSGRKHAKQMPEPRPTRLRGSLAPPRPQLTQARLSPKQQAASMDRALALRSLGRRNFADSHLAFLKSATDSPSAGLG